MHPEPTPTQSPAPPTTRGLHLIGELYGAEGLADVDHVAASLEAAAEACGATILDTRLHPFDEHGGVTGVVLLAESHITIHTWPEHAYAAVDVFLCGDCDPADSLPVLEEAFGPDRMTTQTIERG
jgi:S-adenosylmethionine decarboxylase